MIRIIDKKAFTRQLRALRKYFTKAYKQFLFEVLEEMKRVSKEDGYYSTTLDIDEIFNKVYGQLKVNYIVKDGVVYIENIESWLKVCSLNNETYLSYDEISEITGYHRKYLFKLKNEILDGTISLEHGNKNKKPVNAISEEEKKKIKDLYKRSSVSIRKFAKFYSKRSYSCIYNVIHEDD